MNDRLFFDDDETSAQLRQLESLVPYDIDDEARTLVRQARFFFAAAEAGLSFLGTESIPRSYDGPIRNLLPSDPALALRYCRAERNAKFIEALSETQPDLPKFKEMLREFLNSNRGLPFDSDVFDLDFELDDYKPHVVEDEELGRYYRALFLGDRRAMADLVLEGLELALAPVNGRSGDDDAR